MRIPTIIDVEASGFGSSSYPIEIGFARRDGLRYCTLIKPFNDWTYWDKSAEKIHGISRDMLFEKGEHGIEVCKQLNSLLTDENVYSDGWVVDSPWLSSLFERSQVKMAFKISPLEMILKEPQMAIWSNTKEKVINELNIDRHRASNDAIIIQQTYMQSQGQIILNS